VARVNGTSSGWFHRLWQALRGGATREGEHVRLLEDALAREREEVSRQRAEVARERDETARLRAENRALINSLLGTAGVPPIETLSGHPTQVAAVRRRSWPQISTTREIEAAREARAKERERAAQVGPASGAGRQYKSPGDPSYKRG
jgi:hypothetical protein